MNKKTVVVLFGGQSSEHEVSRVSASTIISNLNSDKYYVIPVGITKKGKWMIYSGPVENIKNGEWENDVSEIRHFKPNYWTIGHVLETGLVVPHSPQRIEFFTIEQYLVFFQNIMVRQTRSPYEMEIAKPFQLVAGIGNDPFVCRFYVSSGGCLDVYSVVAAPFTDNAEI